MSTTRKEYLERKANAATETEFTGWTGQEYLLKRPGPSMSVEVAEVMRDDMPDEDATRHEARAFGLKTMERRKELFPVLLPKYIIKPAVFADDDGDAPKDAIRVSDLHEEDALGILGALMSEATGGRGSKLARKFPGDGGGSGVDGAGPSDESDDK